MSEDVINAMEDIFEVAKQVYNVPNTPLLKEGMDAVAEGLDIINEEFTMMNRQFCDCLENIKAKIADLAASTEDNEVTRKAMTIVKEINIILDGEREENEMV